jgi:hypothetical protein
MIDIMKLHCKDCKYHTTTGDVDWGICEYPVPFWVEELDPAVSPNLPACLCNIFEYFEKEPAWTQSVPEGVIINTPDKVKKKISIPTLKKKSAANIKI